MTNKIVKTYKAYKLNNKENIIPLYLFKSNNNINELDIILSKSLSNTLYINKSILDKFNEFIKQCNDYDIDITVTEIITEINLTDEMIKEVENIIDNKEQYLDYLVKKLELDNEEIKNNISKHYSKIKSSEYFDVIFEKSKQLLFVLSQKYIRVGIQEQNNIENIELLAWNFMTITRFNLFNHIDSLSDLFYSILIELDEENFSKEDYDKLKEKLNVIYNEEFVEKPKIKQILNYFKLLGRYSFSEYCNEKLQYINEILINILVNEFFSYIALYYPKLSYKSIYGENFKNSVEQIINDINHDKSFSNIDSMAIVIDSDNKNEIVKLDKIINYFVFRKTINGCIFFYKFYKINDKKYSKFKLDLDNSEDIETYSSKLDIIKPLLEELLLSLLKNNVKIKSYIIKNYELKLIIE